MLRKKLNAVIDADGQTITELVAIAGLSPASAFRNMSLIGLRLNDQDLTEFRFKGCDVAGCNVEGSSVSPDTFEGAVNADMLVGEPVLSLLSGKSEATSPATRLMQMSDDDLIASFEDRGFYSAAASIGALSRTADRDLTSLIVAAGDLLPEDLRGRILWALDTWPMQRHPKGSSFETRLSNVETFMELCVVVGLMSKADVADQMPVGNMAADLLYRGKVTTERIDSGTWIGLLGVYRRSIDGRSPPQMRDFRLLVRNARNFRDISRLIDVVTYLGLPLRKKLLIALLSRLQRMALPQQVDLSSWAGTWLYTVLDGVEEKPADKQEPQRYLVPTTGGTVTLETRKLIGSLKTLIVNSAVTESQIVDLLRDRPFVGSF